MDTTWENFSEEEKFELMKIQNDIEKLYSIRGLPKSEKEEEIAFHGQLGEFISDASLKQILLPNESINTNEANLMSDFRSFCRPFTEQLRTILIEAWEASRPKNWNDEDNNRITGNQSWDQIRLWDSRSLLEGPCECSSEYSSTTPAVNNRKFWQITQAKIQEIFEQSGTDIEVESIIRPSLRFNNRFLDFASFRSWITSQNEIKLDEKAVGEFSQKELNQFVENNPELAEISYRLNHCSSESNTHLCESCQQKSWVSDFENNDEYFHDIAATAVSTLIGEFIGNSDIQPPNVMQLRKKDGTIVKAKAGKILHAESNSGVRDRSAIEEGFYGALKFVSHFSLKSENGDEYIADLSNFDHFSTYECVETEITKALGREFVHLKPVCFFAKDEFPEMSQLEWANRLAVNVVRLMLDRKFLIRSKKIQDNNSKRKDANQKYMLILINDVIKQLERDMEKYMLKKFDGSNVDKQEMFPNQKSMLRQYFSKNDLKPMRCQPLPRDSVHFKTGGYINKKTQQQNPLITNNTIEEYFRLDRFSPSQSAVSAINHLQNTAWKINLFEHGNIIVQLLHDKIEEELIQNFVVRYEQSEDGTDELFIDFDNTFPSVSHHEVISWVMTLNTMYEFGKEDIVFWHPWSFDWRGRMVTCSTLLSPQNNDLSRAILRFAEPRPLDDDGWMWMKRFVAKFYVGRNELPFFSDTTLNKISDEEVREWDGLQERLKSKSWEAFDEVSEHPVFIKIMKLIAENPDRYFDIWGKGDVFRSKAEGLQRLAFTLAFVSALNDGGVGALVDIPIVLDASSNVYQHSAAMMRDKTMAVSVNVLPNPESEKPADVYLKVLEKVQSILDTKIEKENGSTNDNDKFFSKLDKKLLENLLVRNVMKKPVMTIGYGAKESGIWLNLLHHNGERDGLNGGWIYTDTHGNPLPRDEFYKRCVEANLGEIDADGRFQKSKDLSDYKFKKLRSEQVGKLLPVAHPNSSLGKILERVEPHLHKKIAEEFVGCIVQGINEVLPGFSKMKDALEEIRACVIESPERVKNELGPPVQWLLPDGSISKNVKLDESIADTESKYWSGTVSPDSNIKRSLTIFKYKNERSKRKEKTGLPPNFIHSHDACHMRYVINKLCTKGEKPFWSVHDAFGTHPNDIDLLIQHVKDGFVEIHSAKKEGQGTLQELYGIHTGKALEVGKLELVSETLSEYLIS